VSSTSLVTYSHNDMLGAMSSFNFYYRVKMVNLEGSFEYSDIILVRGSGKNSMVVLGNPFRDQLTVKYTSSEATEVRLQLVDMNGQTIRSLKVAVNAGSRILEIRGLGSIPAGTYMLSMTMNGQRFNQKVIKDK
jgi:large repetitive protein